MLPKSKYSKFFDLITEQKEIIATCKSCEYKKRLKNAQASKSSLRHHLTKHPEEMKALLEFEETENKNKLTKTPRSSKFKREIEEIRRSQRKLKKEDDDGDDETKPQTSESSNWDRGGIMTKRIDEAIVQMICTDIFPLSVTDGPGFKNFLKVVAPKYVPKSRWTITRSHLPALYDKIRTRIIAQLEEAKYIAITTDTWDGDSNNNNITKKETNDHSLISVTAHFINKEMEPTFCVLAARSIKPELNINILLQTIFTEFKIEDKIHVILRGGAMESSGNLNGCHHSIWCQAHILNLAVADGFKQIDGFTDILNRVKDFIKRLKKSPNLLREFHPINSFLEISERELVKGNEVRWNSCFDMLNLLCLNINSVNMLSMDNEKLPFFSLTDWTLIQNLTKILRPIYNATTFLQKRTSCVGYIIPLMKAIELDLVIQPVAIEFPRVRAAIVNGMKCRMGGWEDEANLIIPTLLDPYFKMTLFPVEKHLQYKDWLIYEIQKQCPPLIVHQDEFGALSTSITNESNPFRRVKNYITGNTNHINESASPPPVLLDERFQIFAEVDDYLSRPTETEFHDVSSYWKNKNIQNKYPHLTELFAKFCCAPATSSESERLFSTVNTTLSAMRKGLNGEHLEQLVFCRHNILINGFFD
ncbi:Dimer_Tnp_hAT domain-containing protein [Meloidogyne graminicola]|uniref:Dimer_Tnp_hAT domain-containing protein n=1 Tax=Meloidogyne graminicola TaxID=189291 RepID=A0A8S9ZUP2_9BILA|nr:Dimer_Tnp_hAT domain-containing protein [Meloidogyne graminicola]